MNTLRSSGYKVSYDVRPSKQAERYILIELLNKLQHSGIDVGEYHYVGMGSYFFYDFDLFHHLLGMKKLTSLEGDKSIERRCEYNKPYDDLTLVMDWSTNFLRSASIEDDYLIWLDYDFEFSEIVYNDLVTILPRYNIGTIMFVTIDFRHPDGTPDNLLSEAKEQFPPDLTDALGPRDFRPQRWKTTVIRLIEKTIARGIYGRRDISFLKLFSFEYRDTADMYSFGGIIVDGRLKRRVTRAIKSWPFFCNNKLIKTTKIPPFIFTKKERTHLDRKAHSRDAYQDEIGIPAELFLEYQKFYRYLPVYAEVS